MPASLNENIRNIVFYYIKQKYNAHLKENNKTYIDEPELEMLVNKFYSNEKTNLQEYIRNCLKDMMHDEYNSPLVENVLLEIFSDEELAKNRVMDEITNFQNDKKNKNNVYEALLNIHHKHGIGLKLNFDDSDIIVSNFKKNPDDNSALSAELNNNISIGDSIIQINDINFMDKTTEEIIHIFKSATSNKSHIKLTFKSYHMNKTP